jgi:hypothetical protein
MISINVVAITVLSFTKFRRFLKLQVIWSSVCFFSGVMLPSWDQLTVCTLLAGLVLVLLKALSSVTGKNERVKLPPCLHWLPVVGSLPFIGKLENLGMQFMQKSKTRGKVFAFYAGSRLVISINQRIINYSKC